MKIERRITPNRFETNSRARKLRNSSSVKLGTFPSYSPSLSFFLSFPLSPSLYFLLLFPYVACFQGRVHQLPLFLFSIRDCPSPFSFFFFFVRQFRYSLLPSHPPIPSYLLFGREHHRWSMLFFPLQTSAERAQARGFACSPSAHARSEAYRPEMLTLCRLRPSCC